MGEVGKENAEEGGGLDNLFFFFFFSFFAVHQKRFAWKKKGV